MTKKEYTDADYLSLQIMEIERFRATLRRRLKRKVTFDEALALWIAEGYAEDFRSAFLAGTPTTRPAAA